MKQSIQKSAQGLANATNKVFKQYTLKEIVAHRQFTNKNLFEQLAIYPNQGVGFKVWKKHWADHHYIIVKQTRFKGLRTGSIYGIVYFNLQAKTDSPISLRDCSKRGIWQYDCNGTIALTQNGLHYTADVIKEVMDQHRHTNE